MKNLTGALAATSALSLTLLAGCASNEPAASPELTALRQTIEQAEQADAQHYATREINMARDKLGAAEDAHKQGEEARAANLAEQAKLDAEYASALAQNREAQDAVNALNDTLQTLRNELNTGSTGNAAGGSNAGGSSVGSGSAAGSNAGGSSGSGAAPQDVSPSEPPSPNTDAGSIGSSTEDTESGSGVEGR